MPINRGYRRTAEDQARWAIILPIKNRDVRTSNYRRLTGLGMDEVFRDKIEALKAHGLIFENDRAMGVTKLGAFFADEIAQQFHSADFVPYPREDYAEGPLNPYLNQSLF